MPAGGSWRATSQARSRTCGSARSCIQPCSSHSGIALTSCRTLIAQPRSVRIDGCLSFVIISIETASAGTNLCGPLTFRVANTRLGFRFAWARVFPRVPPAGVKTAVGPCCAGAKRSQLSRLLSDLGSQLLWRGPPADEEHITRSWAAPRLYARESSGISGSSSSCAVGGRQGSRQDGRGH